MKITHQPHHSDCDVILIGAGIMSATLGTLLKELQPDLKIMVFETLDSIAAESSDAWNNAGTGHSALCELNYTPEQADGTIDISKALKIVESFEISKQWWAYLVNEKLISNPDTFIHKIPHLSFVTGKDDVDFLRKRHQALTASHLFSDMAFSDDVKILQQWMPLMMHKRTRKTHIAATRSELGTDVNFGNLTRLLFQALTDKYDVPIYLNHKVINLERNKENGKWIVEVNDEHADTKTFTASFVFIGAGGGALSLLEDSNIPEGDGYGGFPVSGQWLVCKNKKIIAKHHAKVYGKAKVGTPPMSMPHLDSRIIDGKKQLLFGPFAGFSTKFLKEGSYFDLPLSINFDNIIPLISVGIRNLSLTKYLIGQVLQSFDDKIEALREFIPDAHADDWEIYVAGQRVQVIKKDEEEGGVLEFGTEVITATDGSLAALLGASPGASTAVSIMLELIEKCFPEQVKSKKWRSKLVAMIPSYGKHLADNQKLTKEIRALSSRALGLN